MRRSAICMKSLSLMQLWGSFSQSVLHRNLANVQNVQIESWILGRMWFYLSQASQPMGGVRASPLSRLLESPASVRRAARSSI